MHLCNGASGGKVMLGEVFQRFAEKSPIAVMVRGVLERVLSPEQLASIFIQKVKVPLLAEVYSFAVYFAPPLRRTG